MGLGGRDRAAAAPLAVARVAATALLLLASARPVAAVAAGGGLPSANTNAGDPNDIISTDDLRSQLLDPSKRAMVRYDPPTWSQDKLPEKRFFDHMFNAISARAPPDYTSKIVDCGIHPALCVEALGTIPPSSSRFGRRWEGDDIFEVYDGPVDWEVLVKFLAFHTERGENASKRRRRGKRGAGAANVGVDYVELTERSDGEDAGNATSRSPAHANIDRERDEGAPPRPTGRGVYIYREPWALVLDDACGVATIPGEDDGDDVDEPVFDAIALGPKFRDPGYFAVLRPFLRHTIDAGLVANDPDEARWFLVPFDFDRSYALGDCPDPSGGGRVSTHLDRVETMARGLTASEHYRRRNGSDHVYVMLHFLFAPWRRRGEDGRSGPRHAWGNSYFPQSRIDVVRRGTALRYMSLPMKLDGARSAELHLDEAAEHYGHEPGGGRRGSVWWVEGEDWRCTVAVPVLTPPAIEAAWSPAPRGGGATRTNGGDFDDWLDRPYLFHYRGNGAKRPVGGSAELHDMFQAVGGVYPPEKVVISADHVTREKYGDELTKSKFCIVIRGDDPQRSRFNDAVAAGCIPVLINDGWGLAANPFDDWLDYSKFTVSIPERMFMTHAPSSLFFAYGLPRRKLEKMYEKLLEARPYICWGLAAGPRESVGYLVWEHINDYCDVDS